MYNLVSAMGLSHQTNRWEAVDLNTLSMVDLYRRYEQSFAILTNTFSGSRQYCLDLNVVRPNYSGRAETLVAILQSIGNQTLPTSDHIPQISTKYVIYQDAFRAQYKVDPIKPGVDISVDIPMEEKEWLSLTRPGVDYHLFHRSCMVSVNGLFHLTDADDHRAYVVDGMKSCRLSGSAMLGLHSFREVGNLEFVPITSSMIHKRHSGTPYSAHMYIDVGFARPGKTALLVFGGYLHVLDPRVFYQISPTIFGINFQNYPIRDRYFESNHLIDLSSLGLEHIPSNPEQVSNAQLHSDEVLMAWATLSQSFIVFVNNEHLFVDRPAISDTALLSAYASYVEPKFPMVVGVGKMAEYWKLKEDGRWALSINKGLRTNYVFNTTTEDRLISVANTGTCFNPENNTQANWLVIGSDIKS